MSIKKLIERWRISCSRGPLLVESTAKPVDAREAKLRCADELEAELPDIRELERWRIEQAEMVRAALNNFFSEVDPNISQEGEGEEK